MVKVSDTFGRETEQLITAVYDRLLYCNDLPSFDTHVRVLVILM